MDQLKEFFQNKKVKNILDVGTGTGNFLKVLNEICPNSLITGVDPDVESLVKARNSFPEISFHEMVGENLIFDDNSFDVVSISMVLHHLPDVQKTLMEMMRVLKPGGWIIINELFSDNLNSAQEVHKMFHHFRSQIDRLTGNNHFGTFKKEEIIQIVRNAEIQIQLYFEHVKEINLVTDKNELNARIEKMKNHLSKIQGFPEHDILEPQIEEFREKALKYGFQPATNLVIVGQK